MKQDTQAGNSEMMWKRRATRAFTVVLALYAVVAVGKIAVETDVFQVNFRPYYYAATAFEQGLNPYDLDVTSKLAGGTFVSPYAYPPLSLNVFRPFTWFHYTTSYRAYLLVKCAALALCLWLWQRKFLENGVDNVFLAVCLIGFNYTIYWDLQSGNISSVAQTILWLGLFAYTRGRLAWFVACTVAASLFKFTPAFFLILLLLVDGRKKWAWSAIGGAAFVGVQAASYLLYPDLFSAFIENTRKVQGMVSAGAAATRNFEGAPATWPLVKTLFTNAQERAGFALPGVLPVAAFGVLVLLLFGVTWYVVRKHEEPDTRQRNTLFVMLACLLYLMVTPRLMLYEYVIGVLPAYYIIRRVGNVNAAILLIVLMIPAPITGLAPGFKFLVETGTNYYPLLTAYALWALCLYHLWTTQPRNSLHPNLEL